MSTGKDIYGDDPQDEAGRLKDNVFGIMDSQFISRPDRNKNQDSRASTDLGYPDIPVRKGK